MIGGGYWWDQKGTLWDQKGTGGVKGGHNGDVAECHEDSYKV
jgi:hypothetical protein